MGTERLNFEGKVVVATGVGSGIGAAIADCFAACGATVVGLEHDAEKLSCSAARIAKEGGCFHPILADVSSAEDVAKAFAEINARFPTIDVLVNNVGVEFYSEFVDVTVEDWERQIAVNLRAFFCAVPGRACHDSAAARLHHQHGVRPGICYDRPDSALRGCQGRRPGSYPGYGTRSRPTQYSGQWNLPRVHRDADDGSVFEARSRS